MAVAPSYSMFWMFRAYTILFLPLLLPAQPQRPRFEDYSVHGVFKGSPAEPQLTTSWARLYRTRIDRGVSGEEGFRRGREYVEIAGPNYAGHYRVINWGCGSGCLMMVVVDLETGQVFPPPLASGQAGEDQIIIPRLGTGWADFDFRLSSRLFVIKSCPWGSPDPKSRLYRGRQFCGTSYFTIDPNGFHLLRQVKEELIPSPE